MNVKGRPVLGNKSQLLPISPPPKSFRIFRYEGRLVSKSRRFFGESSSDKSESPSLSIICPMFGSGFIWGEEKIYWVCCWPSHTRILNRAPECTWMAWWVVWITELGLLFTNKTLLTGCMFPVAVWITDCWFGWMTEDCAWVCEENGWNYCGQSAVTKLDYIPGERSAAISTELCSMPLTIRSSPDQMTTSSADQHLSHSLRCCPFLRIPIGPGTTFLNFHFAVCKNCRYLKSRQVLVSVKSRGKILITASLSELL